MVTLRPMMVAAGRPVGEELQRGRAQKGTAQVIGLRDPRSEGAGAAGWNKLEPKRRRRCLEQPRRRKTAQVCPRIPAGRRRRLACLSLCTAAATCAAHVA